MNTGKTRAPIIFAMVDVTQIPLAIDSQLTKCTQTAFSHLSRVSFGEVIVANIQKTI